MAVDALDDRERRRFTGEPGEEAEHGVRPPIHLEHDTALIVEHEPAELLLAREPVHERPEADALHDALDARAHAGGAHGLPPPSPASTSSRSRWETVACASWMRGMCCERLTTRWSARPSVATRPPS